MIYKRIMEIWGDPKFRGEATAFHLFTEGAILACYSPREDGDAEKLGETWRPHPSQYLYFSVADPAAARQRCISAGASEVTEVERMPWGETLFYALDPFGNPISFVQSGTEFVGHPSDA